MQYSTCFYQQNKPKIIEIDQKMTELQLFLAGVCNCPNTFDTWLIRAGLLIRPELHILARIISIYNNSGPDYKKIRFNGVIYICVPRKNVRFTDYADLLVKFGLSR